MISVATFYLSKEIKIGIEEKFGAMIFKINFAVFCFQSFVVILSVLLLYSRAFCCE